MNARAIEGILAGQSSLFVALMMSHPDRARLRQVFASLISAKIEEATDPVVSGALQTFEEAVLQAMDSLAKPNGLGGP